MKWFKHDGNALTDDKLESLMSKYGIEGYGFYFGCVELIAERVSEDNPSLELKHPVSVIAHKFYMEETRAAEILGACCDLGLFVNDGTTITCPSLEKRCEDNVRRAIHTVKNRKRPVKHRCNTGKIPSRLEENRLEEKRIEKKAYADCVMLSEDEFKKLVERSGEKATRAAIEKLSTYKLSTGKQYKSDYNAILNWALGSVMGQKGGAIPAPPKQEKPTLCDVCGKPCVRDFGYWVCPEHGRREELE